MRKICTTVILLSIINVALAQRSDNSLPYSFSHPEITIGPEAEMIEPPLEQIQAIKNASLSSPEKAYDFGVALPSSYNLLEHGFRDSLPDGRILVTEVFLAPQAYGLNFNFRRFSPGKSGKLWVYSLDKTMVRGGFDHRSVTPGIPFAVAPVKGEAVILEFIYDPAEADIAVELSEVVYEFADIFEVSRAFGSSGACNRNVNCPEYMAKADQKRSVAMILTQNNVRWCSGAMVNNTAQDGKPYFLTARHCNTTPNSIFMFNYESPDCSNIDGPTQQTIQGCTIRVDWSSSDVSLVELSSVPPAHYFTYFAGWDAVNTPADSVFGIHHPKGDIKKISFDDDAVEGSPYGMGDTALNHWKVLNWEIGTTEQGSSGSPLFNQQGQIVGQLHGGQANCANSINDYYGKFAYSWFGDNTPETSLRFWLDPVNTGQLVLDGADFNAPDFSYDLALTGLAGPDSVYCSGEADWIVTVRNAGMLTVQDFRVRLLRDGEEVAVRDISQTLGYGSTANVTFPAVPIAVGQQHFEAVVEFISPLADENPTDNVAHRTISHIVGDNATVTFRYDLFSSETQWAIYEPDGSPVYQSPPAAAHENMVKSFCLPMGCYLFRVTDNGGDGICCAGGEGSFSIVDSDGDILVQNQGFTNIYEQKFCVPGLPSGWDELFQIYPNPSSTLINVKVQSYAEGLDSELIVFSVDGKVLINEHGSLKYLNTFDVSEWANGIYFVRLRVGKLRSVQKFIKN